MAGNAADSGIRAVVTFAVGQAVGLESHVGFPPPAASDHFFPCAMALAAKARYIFRRQLAQFWGSRAVLALQRVREVSRCARMAMLARDAGFQ